MDHLLFDNLPATEDDHYHFSSPSTPASTASSSPHNTEPVKRKTMGRKPVHVDPAAHGLPPSADKHAIKKALSRESTGRYRAKQIKASLFSVESMTRLMHLCERIINSKLLEGTQWQTELVETTEDIATQSQTIVFPVPRKKKTKDEGDM